MVTAKLFVGTASYDLPLHIFNKPYLFYHCIV